MLFDGARQQLANLGELRTPGAGRSVRRHHERKLRMKTMKWLLKREMWENKGMLLWTPIVVAAVVAILASPLFCSARCQLRRSAGSLLDRHHHHRRQGAAQ
jgi:hypothetical protein